MKGFPYKVIIKIDTFLLNPSQNSFEIPVFIDRKCFGIDCREKSNGPTDAPDDDDGKDDNNLGVPEYTHK